MKRERGGERKRERKEERERDIFDWKTLTRREIVESASSLSKEKEKERRLENPERGPWL